MLFMLAIFAMFMFMRLDQFDMFWIDMFGRMDTGRPPLLELLLTWCMLLDELLDTFLV